jgi:hypothetical protein
MHFGQNILKEIRKNNIPRYKPVKQNSIEKAKKKKKELTRKNKNLYV